MSSGQGGNTVYDETVRLAREIPATDIYLSTIVSDAIVRITDIVTRTLGLTSISVKMDKLSLYGPGGFFSTHKDTPKVNKKPELTNATYVVISCKE